VPTGPSVIPHVTIRPRAVPEALCGRKIHNSGNYSDFDSDTILLRSRSWILGSEGNQLCISICQGRRLNCDPDHISTIFQFIPRYFGCIRMVSKLQPQVPEDFWCRAPYPLNRSPQKSLLWGNGRFPRSFRRSSALKYDVNEWITLFSAVSCQFITKCFRNDQLSGWTWFSE
jgi:hypothetical protein